MVTSKAILTARGGMTSHAAVVARGMGKPCVAGAQALEVDEKAGRFAVNGRQVREGEWITVDGSSGKVFAGQAALIAPELSGNFNRVMKWADRIMQLRVRVNADTPADAHRGRDFGAEGIGLCRTEHMFFEGDRLVAMREMIVAQDPAGRRTALAKLLPMQRDDFYGVFKAMHGTPVTIRTIDPPLHEFLPKREDLMVEIARLEERGKKGKELDEKHALLRRVEQLHEFNPMLGHRGVRLGITYPEITEMQTKAIIAAACQLKKEGQKVLPEIMNPLLGHVNDLRDQKSEVERDAAETMKEYVDKVDYLDVTII
jgi:pyruvate,orthophosphate dikinase